MPPPHSHRTPHKVAAHSRVRAMLDRMTEEHELNSLKNSSSAALEGTESAAIDETLVSESKPPTTPPKYSSSDVQVEVNKSDTSQSQSLTQSTSISYGLRTPGRAQNTALSGEEVTDSTSLRTPTRSNAQAQSPSRSSVTTRPSLLNDRPAPVLELLTQLESGGLSWGDMMMDEDEALMKQQKSSNLVAGNSPSLKSSAGAIPSFSQSVDIQQKIPSISLPPTLTRYTKLDQYGLSQPSASVSIPDLPSPPSVFVASTEAATSSSSDADDSSGSKSSSSNSGAFGFTPSAKFRQLSRKFGITSGSDSVQSSESPISGSVPLFVWQIASQRDRSTAIDLGQRTLLKKLSSPERHRPSAEETARKAEQRQAAAEAKRFIMQEEKRAFLEEQSRRSVNATLRVQERQDEIATSVQSRIEAAQKRYSEVLRNKVLIAESELLKVKEVSAVQRLESENRKAAMQEHLDSATQRADEVIRLRKSKAGEHVTKVHESLQNLKDSQIAESVQKREELDRKLAEGEMRRQNVLSNRKTYGAALTGTRTGVIDLMGSNTSPDGISRTANGLNVSVAAFFAAAAAATVAVGAAPRSIASAAAAASMAAEVASQESKNFSPTTTLTLFEPETPKTVQLLPAPSLPTIALTDAPNVSIAAHPSPQDIPSSIPDKDSSPSSSIASTLISQTLPSLSSTQEVLNTTQSGPVSSSIVPNAVPAVNPWKQKLPPSFVTSVMSAAPAKSVDARRMASSSSSSSVSSAGKVIPENKTKSSRTLRQRSTLIHQPDKLSADVSSLEDVDEQWIEVKTSSSNTRASASSTRVGAPLPAAGNIAHFSSSVHFTSSNDDVKIAISPFIGVPESEKRIGNTENLQHAEAVIQLLPTLPTVNSAGDKLLKTSVATSSSAALKNFSARRKKLKKLAGSVVSAGFSYSQASGSVSLRAFVPLEARSTPPSSSISRAVLALQKASAGASELDATDDWEALDSLQKNTNGAEDDESGHMISTISSVTPDLDAALRDLLRALEVGRSSLAIPLVSPSLSLHLAMLLSTLRDVRSPVNGADVAAPITSLFRFSDETISEDAVSLPFAFSDVSALWNGLTLSLSAKCVTKELYVRAPRSVSYALRVLALSVASPCKGPREWLLAKGVLSSVVDICTIAAFDTAERLSSAPEAMTILGNDDFQANSLLSCLQILWIILQQPSEFSTQSSLVAAETALFQYLLSVGLIPQLFSLLKIMLSSSALLVSVIEPLCISILSFTLVSLKRPILDSASPMDRTQFRAIFSSYSRSDLPVYTDALVSVLISGGNNGAETLTLIDLAQVIVSSKKEDLQFYLQSVLMIIQCLSLVARLDLKALQNALSASEALDNFHNFTNSILDLVFGSPSSFQPTNVKITDSIIQELLLFIGFAALGNKTLQDCLGRSIQGSTTLSRLLSLPERYLVDEHYSSALFPTLLVLADMHESNLVAIKGSSFLPLIIKFVSDNQSRLDDIMDAEGPGGLVGNDGTGSVRIRSSFRLEFRLPPHRWADAYKSLK